MSLTSLLSIARTALLTQQKAIDVTGHNIANANTPGYSRQRLMLQQPLAHRRIGFRLKIEESRIARVGLDQFGEIRDRLRVLPERLEIIDLGIFQRPVIGVVRNSRGYEVTRTLHIACSRLDAGGEQFDHRMGSDQSAQFGDGNLSTREFA